MCVESSSLLEVQKHLHLFTSTHTHPPLGGGVSSLSLVSFNRICFVYLPGDGMWRQIRGNFSHLRLLATVSTWKGSW